ncbi:MAG: hypothetical protein GVY36_16235 [Verrucomicrobia bacterium]|jgi:hypothetical protein|nr:hypothetical protein [Verrucomicrobiota bacterium]
MGQLTEIPAIWDFPSPESRLPKGAASMIDFLSKKVFNDYEPSQFHPFRQRLLAWLNNFDDTADQQHLLALLLEVFFVGRKEFEALYRTVYRGLLFRWMLEDTGVDVFDNDLETVISNKVNKAWICPISDSLRINAFLKVNGLQSLDIRPDWRSLREFGDVEKIQHYVKRKKIRDLVLLEDFCGSGNQATKAIQFAAETLPEVRVLLCPLIVCPKGDEALIRVVEDLAERGFSNVTYEPALVLPKDVVHCFENYQAGNPTVSDSFLCKHKKRYGISADEDVFGYKQTGSKVVLFSNCPNNTLPVFHRESKGWVPLFPRVDRQT